jgi:hypothetical protein
MTDGAVKTTVMVCSGNHTGDYRDEADQFAVRSSQFAVRRGSVAQAYQVLPTSEFGLSS